MARPAGGVFRRGPCALHRVECRLAKGGVFHTAGGIHRGGDANRGRVSGDRAGGDTGGHGLFAD